jgi:hypothetical protein
LGLRGGDRGLHTNHIVYHSVGTTLYPFRPPFFWVVVTSGHRAEKGAEKTDASLARDQVQIDPDCPSIRLIIDWFGTPKPPRARLFRAVIGHEGGPHATQPPTHCRQNNQQPREPRCMWGRGQATGRLSQQSARSPRPASTVHHRFLFAKTPMPWVQLSRR